jgi:hypothetical protein
VAHDTLLPIMQLAESLLVSTKITLSYFFSSYLSLSYSLKIGEVKTTHKIIKLYKPIFIVFAFLDSKGGAFYKLKLLLIKS